MKGNKVKSSALLVLLFIALVVVAFNFGRVDNLEIKEYYAWLEEEENGLVKKKDINGYEIKVKYIPGDLLVYNEVSQSGTVRQEVKDSIFSEYKNSLYFILTIKNEPGKRSGDIIYHGLNDIQEYEERLENMVFRFDEYITFKCADVNKPPRLTHMERNYGMGEGRTITLVADADILKSGCPELSVVFEDPIFKSGINYFTFNTDNFKKIPNLKY